MSNKNKFIATLAFYVLIGGLLIYAASRTLHFVQAVMANSLWGYLFLFATGVGSVIWAYVYLSYAQGAKQRAIAFVMGIVDILGELALVYADTIYVGDKAGLVTMAPDEMNLFITISVAIVGVNIFAGYMFKLFDLRVEEEQQAQDLVDHVTDATMKHMNTPEVKAQMVNELMPVLKDAIQARVTSAIFERASHTGAVSAEEAGWPLPDDAMSDGPKDVVKKAGDVRNFFSRFMRGRGNGGQRFGLSVRSALNASKQPTPTRTPAQDDAGLASGENKESHT